MRFRGKRNHGANPSIPSRVLGNCSSVSEAGFIIRPSKVGSGFGSTLERKKRDPTVKKKPDLDPIVEEKLNPDPDLTIEKQPRFGCFFWTVNIERKVGLYHDSRGILNLVIHTKSGTYLLGYECAKINLKRCISMN